MVIEKVETEKAKARVMLEHDMNKCTKSLTVYHELPMYGKSAEDVAKEARQYLELGLLFIT